MSVHPTKPIAIKSIVALVVLVILGLGFYMPNNDFQNNFYSIRLVTSALAEYHKENGDLPSGWQELEGWTLSKGYADKITFDISKKFMIIDWKASVDEKKDFITINEGEFKGNETGFNENFWLVLSTSKKTLED